MTLTDKMKAWEPAAVWSEAGEGMFTVPAEAFRGVAERLKAEGFDFLRSLTGMDWGEEGFGVVYHLEATSTGENVVVRTLTPERERPVLPSVCDLWKAAELNEREAFDYFGIRFLNHPDMRRLYLRDDWVGHPLRKDYDPASNPLRMSNEVSKDSAPTFELQPDGSFIRGRNVLFEEEEYVINVGPQHPATHGVLRFRVSLEGEIIKKLDVHCGYIHRGIEKMCEELTYPQTLALTDRLDYLGASQNRHALCMCIEKGLGVEVPERVQYIRTIMDELQRIDSHLLFFACLCMDMGALTAFFYGFRDREKVLDILEQTTGGRLIQTYNTIGGVQADIHPDFVRKVKEFIAYMRPVLREYHEIFTGNVIAQERLKGTGVLTREDAISFGATGGTGRAAGWACDVRKRHPYAVYGKVDFEEVLFTEGDCLARYMVRMREIEQSMHIIEQLIDNIPEGEYQLKMKPVIRIPEGSYYAAVEGSRGEFGVFIESRGDKFPYRMKFRSSCLPLVSVVDPLARGAKIGDVVGNRHVRLVPDGGNDRDLGIINGPGHALVVERPEILHRAAAAAGNDEVRDLIAVGIADRARDLRRGLRALHAYRQELDLGQRIPLAENAEHIHDRRACGRCDDGDRMWVSGQRLFVRRVKQALPGELFLQLLERDIQIARAVCRQRTAIELVRAVAREDADAAEGDDLHAVFRAKAKL